MDLRLTEDELAFRAEVRAFVRDNLPASIREKTVAGRRLSKDDYERWTRILAAKGWGAPHWPQEWGGAGLEPDPTLDLSRRDAARQRARTGRVRRQHGRPGDLHFWLRGAETAIPAAHHRSPRLVVPGLLGARRGIRPCELEDKRPVRRRRLGDLGPEDLDHHGPIRRLDFRARPHQRAGEKAGGHFVLPRRHEDAWDHGEADPDDRRRPRGQRGLFRRRARSGRRACRRREQGVGLRQVPARQRAQRHRPRRGVESASGPGAPARLDSGLWLGAEDRGSLLPRQARRGRSRAEGARNDADAGHLEPRTCGQARSRLLGAQDQGLGDPAGDHRSPDGGRRTLRAALSRARRHEQRAAGRSGLGCRRSRRFTSTTARSRSTADRTKSSAASSPRRYWGSESKWTSSSAPNRSSCATMSRG